jgi:hypothetical protein
MSEQKSKDSGPPQPIAGLPAKTPHQQTPEMRARIDEFNRQIGPAMVESLNKVALKMQVAPIGRRIGAQ